MQPSKQRETDDSGSLDDVEDLLEDGHGADGGVDAGQGAGSNKRSAATTARSTDATPGRIGVTGRWLSMTALAIALGATGGGAVLGGLIPLIGGTIGTAGGVLLGAFLFGMGARSNRYAESGLAGALVGAATAVTSVLGIGFLPVGIDYLSQWGLPLLAVGGGVGLCLGLLGHYLGRDLRAGVTQELPG